MNIYLQIILLIGLIHPLYVASRILPAQVSSLYSVLDHGAVGDGSTDDSQAFMQTWGATCNSPANSFPTMLIPADKKYLIKPVVFNGPCQSPIVYFQINGEIQGPQNPNDWNCDGKSCFALIHFNGLTGMEIFGGGAINGQGAQWWNNPDEFRPVGMQIQSSSNVNVRDLSFKDNPKMHLRIQTSVNVNVKNLIITAPEHSPNTDGIHITGSTNVTVEDSIIGTGDDCISIVNGTSYMKARNITCGPGHGISIGSLGERCSYNTVEHITIKDVTFTNTKNGARIKTWQCGKGYARDIVFDGLVCNNASNLIIIDQYYCAHAQCQIHQSAVQIQDVTFKNVTSTSPSEVAVKLACSENVPCLNIVMDDIYILSDDGSEKTSSSCTNAEGTIEGREVPTISCLKQASHSK